MTAPTTDPFAGSGESVPTLSFADAAVGTTYEGILQGPAEKVQGKEFGTDEPAVWRNKDGTTSPKYSAVLRLKLTDSGEERSLWAVIPSAMFAALKDAQTKAGKAFEEGGKLSVRFTGTEPASRPGLAAKKLYAAKYEPPAPKDVFATGDAPSGTWTKGDDTPPW